MAAQVTLGMFHSSIQTRHSPLFPCVSALSRGSDIFIRSSGDWLLLVLLILVTLRYRLTVRWCRRSGRKAPKLSTAELVGVVIRVVLIVILGLFVLFLAWLRRAGSPTRQIRVQIDLAICT